MNSPAPDISFRVIRKYTNRIAANLSMSAWCGSSTPTSSQLILAGIAKWSKANASRAFLVGVQGFDSLSPHKPAFLRTNLPGYFISSLVLCL